MPDGRVKYLRTKSYGSATETGGWNMSARFQDATEHRLFGKALAKVSSRARARGKGHEPWSLAASIAHEVSQPLSGHYHQRLHWSADAGRRSSKYVDGASRNRAAHHRDGNRASEVITRLRALFSIEGGHD